MPPLEDADVNWAKWGQTISPVATNSTMSIGAFVMGEFDLLFSSEALL